MRSIVIVCLSILSGIIYNYLSPHILHLLRVGSGFSALTVCSGVFVSDRTYDSLALNELAGISVTLFGVDIDKSQKVVYSFPTFFDYELANRLGLPTAVAAYINPQLGCRLITGGNVSHRPHSGLSAESRVELPLDINKDIQDFINWEFTEDAYKQNQTRAIVVLHNGKIVAEGYQDIIGVQEFTPLLGWSMTKSLHAAIVGAAINKGIFNITTPAKLSHMTSAKRNEIRQLNGDKDITIGDLLTMIDILTFEENYKIHGTVPHMLFASHDAALFASNVNSRTIEQNAVQDKKLSSDFNFDWYYSSGLSNILAKEVRDLFNDDEKYWKFPQEAIFTPLGISSFTVQTDPSGTFVASSFSYGSARAWACVGQLFLQNGIWNGNHILSPSFVEFIQQPHTYSAGHYGGSFWLNPARVSVKEYNYLPLTHSKKVQQKWLVDSLPSDAYLMSGFDGQYTMIVPSANLVIARLGFTSDSPDKVVWDKSLFFETITNHVLKKSVVL
jgi:CubicO group peptidase (beta-lactamase class C family)